MWHIIKLKGEQTWTEPFLLCWPDSANNNNFFLGVFVVCCQSFQNKKQHTHTETAKVRLSSSIPEDVTSFGKHFYIQHDLLFFFCLLDDEAHLNPNPPNTEITRSVWQWDTANIGKAFCCSPVALPSTSAENSRRCLKSFQECNESKKTQSNAQSTWEMTKLWVWNNYLKHTMFKPRRLQITGCSKCLLL